MVNDNNLLLKVATSKVAEKIYDDGISKPVQEISKFAVDCLKTIRLFSFPIQLTAAMQDWLERKLKNVAQKVPEENRIIPPNSLLVPILERLSYIEESNILAILFENLLARSMDKKRNSEAHPAFISLISQLSPDEALLLCQIRCKKFKFVKTADLDNTRTKFSNSKIESNEFPIHKLIFPNNFSMYLGHLEKLDLICVHDKHSQPIWEENLSKKIQIGIRDTYIMGFTQFGDLFGVACLLDNELI